MLDYTNDPKLLERAFEIAARNDKYAFGLVEINGVTLAPYDWDDAKLLELLALSPVREKIEELRDSLNEALGELETSPAKDVADAIALLMPHLRSGFIKNIRSQDGGFVIEENDGEV